MVTGGKGRWRGARTRDSRHLFIKRAVKKACETSNSKNIFFYIRPALLRAEASNAQSICAIVCEKITVGVVQ